MMAPAKHVTKHFTSELLERIKRLEAENEKFDAGIICTREARVHRDGRRVLIDTTQESIARNNQWMADLQTLLATLARRDPPAKTAQRNMRGPQRRQSVPMNGAD